jgi:hypothetical protein
MMLLINPKYLVLTNQAVIMQQYTRYNLQKHQCRIVPRIPDQAGSATAFPDHPMMTGAFLGTIGTYPNPALKNRERIRLVTDPN